PHEVAAILLERHVEHGLHWLIESPLTDVRGYAHHRQPLAAIVQADAPAERLARTTRKAFARNALADDRHFRRVRRVPCGELASRQLRNLHGLEIARVDLRLAGIELRLRLTLDVE